MERGGGGERGERREREEVRGERREERGREEKEEGGEREEEVRGERREKEGEDSVEREFTRGACSRIVPSLLQLSSNSDLAPRGVTAANPLHLNADGLVQRPQVSLQLSQFAHLGLQRTQPL